MKLRRPKKRHETENIIPLINIVFLLLIFFMITAKLASSDAIEIQPPISQHPANKQSQNTLTIYLTNEGKIFLENRFVSTDLLIKYVSEQQITNDNLSVMLKASAHAPAIKLVQILEKLKQIKVQNIELLTQSKPD